MKIYDGSNILTEMTNEDMLATNGGIVPEVVAALITAGVAVVGGIHKLNMDNAANRGKNDAYNDINTTIYIDAPIYTC